MRKFFMILLCAVAVVMLAGCGKAALEKDAVPVVNKFVEDNFGILARAAGKKTPKCIKVELAQEINDDVWTGKAFFDNGKSVDCTVKEQDDQVYVEVNLHALRCQ